MATSSLRLIAKCQQQGLLSKEAAAEVLEAREELIKEAMRKHAGNMFSALLRRSGRRAGPPLPPPPKTGILDKLKTGGRTPGSTRPDTPDTGWSDVIANLGKMMAVAGLAAGATSGVGHAIRHSKDKKLKAEVQKSYHQMFKEHPGLRDVEEHEPGRVRRHFGVLARYAPSLAADPVIAGQWVQATATTGQINTGDVKNLAETQRRIDEAREGRGKISLAPLKVTDFATKAMMM